MHQQSCRDAGEPSLNCTCIASRNTREARWGQAISASQSTWQWKRRSVTENTGGMQLSRTDSFYLPIMTADSFLMRLQHGRLETNSHGQPEPDHVLQYSKDEWVFMACNFITLQKVFLVLNQYTSSELRQMLYLTIYRLSISCVIHSFSISR